LEESRQRDRLSESQDGRETGWQIDRFAEIHVGRETGWQRDRFCRETTYYNITCYTSSPVH
jgi:hypothetical protein